jgi:peptide/bleomycin uptake transporter
MFVSFFPSPRAFFWSAALWSLFAILVWLFGASEWGQYFGLPNSIDDKQKMIGAATFISNSFIWFYIYYAAFVFVFCFFWQIRSPVYWFKWSVLGSALIIFVVYFQVQVSVEINKWQGPFFDLLQKALGAPNTVKAEDIYAQLFTFAGIAFTAVALAVLNRFFVNHYIFRWRTAMNAYYMQHWHTLRQIEGSSQRVQDDTMRFARIAEGLGVDAVSAITTLIAFLPILHELESKVQTVPFIGAIPLPLVTLSIVWALFGTIFLAFIGGKLPGLEFKNQRVEAAYRKELVYGEDNADRVAPETVQRLFSAIRQNYFTIYLHYVYFNIARVSYNQVDTIFPFIVLAPSIVAGAAFGLTWGILQRILGAFSRVRDAFQILIDSWTTIIEMLSIYKRLRTFEAAIHGEPIDPRSEYQSKEAAA